MMSGVELVDKTHPEADENRFKDVEEATVFLKEASRRKANLDHFNLVWAPMKPKRKAVSQVQERDRMFKGLAERLASGELRVRHRPVAAGGMDASPAKVTVYAEPKQTWSGGQVLKVRDRPDPAPPPPPEPPMNVKQQVEALQGAAEAGTPFCERCQEQQK
jgi:hypothetical protein